MSFNEMDQIREDEDEVDEEDGGYGGGGEIGSFLCFVLSWRCGGNCERGVDARGGWALGVRAKISRSRPLPPLPLLSPHPW